MNLYKIIFIDKNCAYVISEHKTMEEAEKKRETLSFETNEYNYDELKIVRMEEDRKWIQET